MQLKNKNKLALAATGLLSAVNVSTASAGDWDHEAAVLYYGESDERVIDGSVKYKGVRTDDAGKILSLNIGIDTLTGSSPSGVTTSTSVQTLTSPSGNGTVVHPANELPLDDTFRDTRVSGGASWDQSIIDEKTRGNAGFSFSKEYDYLHLGVSGGLSRELNNKNTTFSVGLAYSADTVEPVGGSPKALTSSDEKGAASESKDVIDAVIGVTQVLSKDTILQFNYGISQADGYLNDPYKWVSRVDSTGTIVENLHESRPDSRVGQNLYAAIKHNVSADNILSSSARFYSDDWGINSITLDTKYRFDLGNKRSIEPHLRYYHQSAADFYAVQLDSADALPEHASADYRLAEFDAYTIGGTYRWGGSNNRKWRVTGEYYSQNPAKVELTDDQAGLDANPGFDALMLSMGVKF